MTRVFDMLFRLPLCCAAFLALASWQAAAQSRPAQCLLEVKGAHYLGGPCVFTPLDKSGSFRIADAQGKLIAQINVTEKDAGKAVWNGPKGGGEPVVALGDAFRATACWTIDDADDAKYYASRICAWGTDDKVYLGASPGAPDPANTVYWGSRVGMYSAIASRVVDSADAQVTVRPSRDAAVTFCREYSSDYSMKCIDEQMRDSPSGVLRGNCKARTFVNLEGYKYAFVGKMPKGKENVSAKYAIRYMATGEILDGSTASSYDIALGIYQALCPATAPKSAD